MNEAQRAAFVDERDFLLRSLDDLELERAAGDLDADDYEALRDDYTARAAAVLRALARADEVTVRPREGRRWSRLVAVGGLVAVFALAAGVLVARNAGRREPGQTATGIDPQSVTQQLNTAGRLAAAGDLEQAIDAYDDVLEVDPANVEALAYRGWILTLDGRSEEGLASMIEAATTDPTYPDVHAFLAIVFFRSGLVEQADRELERLDALDPPAAIRDLVSSLRAQVDAALAATSTTTTSTSTGA